MYKYWRVYKVIWKYSVVEFINHRLGLLFYALANVTWLSAQLLSLNFMFQKIPTLTGWTYPDLVMLMGLSQIYVYVAYMIYDINLDKLPDRVIKGEVDIWLLKPLNIKFLASFQKFSIAQLFSFIVTLTLTLGYSFQAKNLTWEVVFPALIILTLGIFILYFLRLALAGLAFYFDDVTSIKGLFFNELSDINRIPLNFLPNSARLFLTIVIPLGFVAYYPGLLIRGEAVFWQLILVELILLVIAIILSNLSWKWGLKHYSGVG